MINLIHTAALLSLCVMLGWAFVMFITSQQRRVGLTKWELPATIVRAICPLRPISENAGNLRHAEEFCDFYHTAERLII